MRLNGCGIPIINNSSGKPRMELTIIDIVGTDISRNIYTKHRSWKLLTNKETLDLGVNRRVT